MKVEWSADARKDLSDITEYIASRNPLAAIELDALLSSAPAKLADFPMLGRVGGIDGTREILPHRHYRIVYSVADGIIKVLAIVHTSRQWPPVEDDA